MLTQKEVKGLLNYNPETGQLRWRVARGRRSHGDVGGAVHSTGYRYIGINGKKYRAHIIIWLYMTGSFPVNQVDHSNGEKDDNWWSNLRAATHRENQWNKAMNSNNTTGYKGVYRSWNKFIARLQFDGKQYRLGSFPTAELAHEAYCKKAKELHGEYYHRND